MFNVANSSRAADLTRSIKLFLSRRVWASRILRLRIVDREFAEAAAGRAYSSDRAAVTDYLNRSHVRSSGVSLHPLVEPD